MAQMGNMKDFVVPRMALPGGIWEGSHQSWPS